VYTVEMEMHELYGALSLNFVNTLCVYTVRRTYYTTLDQSLSLSSPRALLAVIIPGQLVSHRIALVVFS
jgi:hypothetical protein